MAAKVLLVEDDNNLREIYEARLKAEGYDIASAQDGEEALVVAKNQKPDLIISDVMMPKISGFEMLDILRNTDGLKDVKIIMLTALGQAEDKTRADNLGANKYLVKSQVTLEDIVTTAHELLGDTQEPAGTTPAAPAPTTPAAPSALETAAVTPATASPTPNEPVATAIPIAVATEPGQPASTPVAPEPTPPPIPPTAPAVPEPPVAPAATPAPEPATTPAVPAAQTTAQEETEVKDQIDTFVNSTPSAPVPDASAPTSPSDQMMQTAVNDMVASTEPSTPPVPAVETPTAPVVPSAPETPVTPTKPPEEDTALQTDSVSIAHKKVIQPIDSDPKPNLEQLLAIEEAKSAVPSTAAVVSSDVAPTSDEELPAGVPTPPPSGVVTPNPATPPAAPGSTDIDPNSISL